MFRAVYNEIVSRLLASGVLALMGWAACGSDAKQQGPGTSSATSGGGTSVASGAQGAGGATSSDASASATSSAGTGGAAASQSASQSSTAASSGSGGAPPDGSSCAAAIPVAMALGKVTLQGNTVGGGSYFAYAPFNGFACSADKSYGQDAPDRVYDITPKTNGWLTATLTPKNGFAGMLWMYDGVCQAAINTIWCAKGGANVSVSTFRVFANKTYHLFVDGALPQASGAYQLDLDLSVGTCADPVPLPIGVSGPGVRWHNGMTTGMPDEQVELCPNMQVGGLQSPDVVFELTPATSYPFNAKISDYYSALTAAMSLRAVCGDEKSAISVACQSSAVDITVSGMVTQGKPVYLVVDGYQKSTGQFLLQLN
jgi:hypothetical protein